MPSFYEDVIKNDARFNRAKRVADPELIEPVTRAAIANILQDARALGIELMVFETYRSQARQQELFNQGASKLRVVGVHHYGLACDLVKAVAGEPSWKGDFSFLGKLAHDHRLIWGVSRFVLPGCAVRPVCSGSAGNSGCVGNLAFPNSLAHRR